MIFNGWKSIAAYLEISSIKTLRKLVQSDGLPIVKICRRPWTSTELINEWLCDHYLEQKKTRGIVRQTKTLTDKEQ